MRKFLTALLLSTVIAVFASGTAHAIVVDGIVNPVGEWDDYFILGTDPNEGSIADNYDIARVYAWWDEDDVYLRTDVFGTPTLERQDAGNFSPAFYQWSIDTDGDDVADLIIVYNADDLGLVQLLRADDLSVLGAGTGAIDEIVEVSFGKALVPLDLEPDSNANVSMFLRLDNAGEDSDDRLPNSGWIHVTPEPASMILFGFGLLGLGGGVLRKRKKGIA